MQIFSKNITYIRRTMAGILLLIFASYFANISLFSHYHVVDGVTIVHSHFHNGDHTQDPFDTSTHTKSELTMISELSNFYAERPINVYVSSVILALICTLLIELSASIISINGVQQPPLRGPPAEVLIS